MISPNNNTNNLNDFISNNTLFGNNLYISPMNDFSGTNGSVGTESSLVAGLNATPDQITTRSNKKITSFFFPMVKMI